MDCLLHSFKFETEDTLISSMFLRYVDHEHNILNYSMLKDAFCGREVRSSIQKNIRFRQGTCFLQPKRALRGDEKLSSANGRALRDTRG